MKDHVWYTPDGMEGVAGCRVCRGFEGSTPTECPGVAMSSEVGDLVYAGSIDYREGRWQKPREHRVPIQAEPRKCADCGIRESHLPPTCPGPQQLIQSHELALEAAARGMVSGTLAEWPVLRAAFRARGLSDDPEMGLVHMRSQARRAIAYSDGLGPPDDSARVGTPREWTPGEPYKDQLRENLAALTHAGQRTLYLLLAKDDITGTALLAALGKYLHQWGTIGTDDLVSERAVWVVLKGPEPECRRAIIKAARLLNAEWRADL